MYYYEYFTEVQVEPTISEITKIFEDNKRSLFIDILEKIWSLNASKQIKGFGKHEIETTVNTLDTNPISDITVQDYQIMKIKIVSREPSSRPVIYNKPIGPITMIGPINIFYLNSDLNNNTIFNLEFKKNNTKLTPQLDYIVDTLKKSKTVFYINDIDTKGKVHLEDLDLMDHRPEVLILDNIRTESQVYIKNKYRLTLIVLNSNIKVEFIYKNPTTECPKTECPKTECPKIECPKTECPKIECPKTECPKTECPKIECPKTECPKTECPKTECPKTECPVESNYTIWFVLLILIIVISVGINVKYVLFSSEKK
jgi:hypothetical protein